MERFKVIVESWCTAATLLSLFTGGRFFGEGEIIVIIIVVGSTFFLFNKTVFVLGSSISERRFVSLIVDFTVVDFISIIIITAMFISSSYCIAIFLEKSCSSLLHFLVNILNIFKFYQIIKFVNWLRTVLFSARRRSYSCTLSSLGIAATWTHIHVGIVVGIAIILILIYIAFCGVIQYFLIRFIHLRLLGLRRARLKLLLQ